VLKTECLGTIFNEQESSLQKLQQVIRNRQEAHARNRTQGARAPQSKNQETQLLKWTTIVKLVARVVRLSGLGHFCGKTGVTLTISLST
jgi:hypothetical protein